MKRYFIISLMLLIPIFLLSCNTTTKGDLCLELMYAYCDKLNEMGCPEASSDCKATQKDFCTQLFTNDCEAPDEEIELIRDHHIPAYITDKPSCESLDGMDGHLRWSMEDIQTAVCADGNFLEE